MANNPFEFDKQWVKGSTNTSASLPSADEQPAVAQVSTVAPKEASSVKQFLKAPVKEAELVVYGTGKPERIVIRAKLIHGKG